MTEEVSPSLKVKVVNKNSSGLKFSLSSFLLIIFCCFLIIISTFVQLNISYFSIPEGFFTGQHLKIDDYVSTFSLIPQVPAVMFVAAILGRKFGTTTVILYILLGLFIIPVFALGGGWRYIFEYSFGYILAYIPAVFITGTILKDGFTYKNIAKALICGILIIHLAGIIYMLIIAGLKHEGWMFIGGWITSQSGVKIIYDFIFSFFAVLAAKYLRLILWLYL